LGIKKGQLTTAHFFHFQFNQPDIQRTDMANLKQKTGSLKKRNCANVAQPLDTLAHLASEGKEVCQDKDLKRVFRKRAWAKSFSNMLAFTLVTQVPDSPLVKQYRNTLYCSSELTQEENKITSKYCGQRWCAVCNGIRTGKNINRFKPAFEKLKQPMFLTLTAPTVEADKLKEEITTRLAQFSRAVKTLKQYLRRSGKPDQVQIIRKLEVTYSKGKYHPHFHCIVEGAENANDILKYWMQSRPDADIEAQNIKDANIGSLNELFKYTTKLVFGKKGEKKLYPAQVLDTIFLALSTRRTFQTYGNLEQAIEEVEEYQTQGFNIQPENQTFVWINDYKNWLNQETGELIVDSPNYKDLESIFANIPESITQPPPDNPKNEILKSKSGFLLFS